MKYRPYRFELISRDNFHPKRSWGRFNKSLSRVNREWDIPFAINFNPPLVFQSLISATIFILKWTFNFIFVDCPFNKLNAPTPSWMFYRLIIFQLLTSATIFIFQSIPFRSVLFSCFSINRRVPSKSKWSLAFAVNPRSSTTLLSLAILSNT